MNEPYTNYWSAYSNKQEGCHFDIGDSQSNILNELNKELESRGIDIVLAGTDETSIDTAIKAYNALDDEAKAAVDRIDTHTYSGSKRSQLKELAESEGKNLWMSEVDGKFTAGTDAGEMTDALGIAQRMMTDINGLDASAWILWNAIDMHADSTNEYDYDSLDELLGKVDESKGFWGIAFADHDNEKVELSKKYYGFGQISRYVRPGDTIIGSSDENNILAAYDKKDGEVVIVAMNTSDEEKTEKFDLSDFSTVGTNVEAIRTSGTLEDGENWSDVSDSDDIKVDQDAKTLTAELKANSITTYTIDGVSYDSSEEVIKSVEDTTVYTVEGFDAKLPETVTVKTNKNNTKTAAVSWDTADKDLSKNGETVEGTVEGTDITAKATIKAAENNLAWYIDCNNAESTTYKEIDEYADLLNETPDQKYSDGSWGYVGDYGKYGPDNCDVSDSYDIGYYAYNGQDIQYKLPMTAGDYKLTFGFKEWWWVNRPMKITAEVNGKTTTLGTTNSLNGSKNWNTAKYEFTLDEDAEVTFTVAKTGSSDPVLSFIKAQKLLDLDGLKAAIVSADSIDESAYPERRVSDVKEAAENGRTLLVKAAATQEDIDSAEKAIEDAIANLNTKITKEDIEENDNVLYLVNAGADDASLVPEDYVLGVCQSNTDQEYTEDPLTGMKWGIEPDDQYSEAVKGGSGDGLTDTYIYMSPDVTFKKGVSGFKYKFEVPETGDTDYNVTVGFKNPWSSRVVNVTLEGETAARSLSLPQGTLVEETYDVEVKDGELNVMIHNPNRTSQYADPILSYIIVKAGKKSEEEKEIKTYSSITGTAGERLYDTSGNKVQAHGGQISKFTVNGETKYYWYGEDKTYGTDPVTGVHLYTSDDLYNWDDQGVVLRTIVPDDSQYGSYATEEADLSVFEDDEYFKALYGDYEGQEPDDDQYDSKLEETYWNLAGDRCIIERPKVIYNEKTKKYVMWFHADGMMKSNRTASSKYSKARAGIAISDTPDGPFKLVGCYKLATSEDADLGWDTVGGSVRDMNLFVDDDGQAYVVYSSDGNSTMYIAKLNEEYTGIAGNEEGVDFTRNFIGSSREAPAPFKYNGKYYIITSGCTGWAPNQASYAVADSMLGPWTTMGNPCVDDTTNTTFDTQSTYVIPYDAENGKYIYVGDRWFNPDEGKDLSDSRYVLLPIEFGTGNTISLKKYENWTLDELENKGSFEVNTDELPEVVESAADLESGLPSEVKVDYGKGEVTEAVTWEADADENALGEVELTGTLADTGRTFTHKVSIADPDTIYFFDSGAETSDYFDVLKKNVKALRNTEADQRYTADNKAGYEGVLKSENSSSYDLGHHDGDDYLSNGWWAASNKDIVYSFDLEEGEYTVTEGFQEWWSTKRPCNMTVEAGDDVLAETSFNVEKTSTNLQISQKFTVDAEHAGKVTVRVAKTGSADPVISFVGVRKAGAGDENVYTLKKAWGKTFCMNQDGERVTGFAVVDGATRYFDPEKKGAMKTSAFFKAQGSDGEEHTFYAAKDGSLVKGFMKTWTGSYYFDENGYMVNDGIRVIDGDTYYFNEDGKMYTGWMNVGDDTYRFAKDGKMITGKISVWGRTYEFDENGKLVK
ncbi:MAG: family 43 glycosylhydrolase [Lachnospiraceae bacterium]|nr:family 43 glycosylhydrolase [Lachnospiraceae bacterium]